VDRSRAEALTAALERLRVDLHRILRSAVDAVEPARLLAEWYARGPSTLPRDRVDVVAAGKAAWAMAAGFGRLEEAFVHRLLIAGPRPHGAASIAGAEWLDAAHPLPNDASVQAGERALEIAREGAAASRPLVVLLSGGASAMLCVPVPPLTRTDKAVTARALMRAGVPIDGLNCVRKHLSGIKGGRLAAAALRSVTLAVSDVHAPVADDPAVIGSGPTVADPTTFADALGIVESVPDVPAAVREHLRRGAAGATPETIKSGDPRLRQAALEVIAGRRQALAGAARRAERLGYEVIVEDEPTSGEAREVSHQFLVRARRAAMSASRPLCVIAGGETTVTVVGEGQGGRNQEFALAATPAMASLGRASVLASAGTDVVDGPTDAAGAMVDSTTLERSSRLGLDWTDALARNDAYHFFGPLGDLITWGPTGTNVGDVHVLLVA
jgi:glycerate-2-kinase